LKSSILIVEDNVDLLFNLKLILESNNYQIITAKNGKEAIKVLSELYRPPDIILSDIMMPKMNGYDFFKEISNDTRWHRIPFIFLTARTSSKDIRLGKSLGVDDYITKPFIEKDLLAIISGKIIRAQRISLISKKIEELFSIQKFDMKTSIPEQRGIKCLLLAYWDDKYGPKLREYYPEEKDFPIPIDDIVSQLFMAATSIYGQEKMTKAEGLLLNIKNINSSGYLYFDSYPDKNERYREKQFMLAYISPIISYLDSLKFKEIFRDISQKIKSNNKWDIKNNWEKINDIQSTSSIDAKQF
jgi:DNA-binding response OmpR family regulator